MRKDLDVPNTQYFEGVLQIRAKSGEVYEFVDHYIEKDQRSAISRIVKVNNGVDYYLTNQKYLRKITERLKDNFKGEIIFSKKLFTRNKQTSKEVYRVNALFREFPYKKGDMIDLRGDKFEIVLIGNEIVLRDIKSLKKTRYSLKDFRKDMNI